MIRLFLIPFLCFPLISQAQLYKDASIQLPDNGAKKASMDVRAADLNNDGHLDIILANEFQPNTILMNDGTGRFTDTSTGNLPQTIHDSEDVAIADFNGDGHLDLVFCSEDDVNLNINNVHEYYLGNGTGNFTTAAYKLPDSEANAVITADINGDGRPDLLFGNNGPTGVLINANQDSFTVENNRIQAVNRTTQDLTLADVDGDGDLDLFEGNENGNLLHINDGNGFFDNQTLNRLPGSTNIETRKVSFGDIDGDDDLDIFLSNVAFIPGRNPQNRLWVNDGKGFFSDATATQLPSDTDLTIDAIFEDVDLDGDLDLVVANVFGAPVKIYGNDGEGNFTNISQEVLGQSYFRDALGVIAADLNGNGLRDLYICDRFQNGTNRKDLLLLRDMATSITAPTTSNSVLLYPNPAQDYFYIRSPFSLPDSVALKNSKGQLMARLKSNDEGEKGYRFDIAALSLSDGLYFIEAENRLFKLFVKRL